jgi:hypothetical protein
MARTARAGDHGEHRGGAANMPAGLAAPIQAHQAQCPGDGIKPVVLGVCPKLGFPQFKLQGRESGRLDLAIRLQL